MGRVAPAATRTAADYANAVHFLRPRAAAWHPRVLSCSALHQQGIDAVWQTIGEHRAALDASGEIELRRSEQASQWMWSEVTESLVDRLRADASVAAQIDTLDAAVRAGTMAPTAAAQAILAGFLGPGR